MTNKKILLDMINEEESEWEINPGKTDKTNDFYVSIESNYKPGMYLTVGKSISDGIYDVVLSQDVYGTSDEANSMTFKTLQGATENGIIFESVLYQGYYLQSENKNLILTSNPDSNKATFKIIKK